MCVCVCVCVWQNIHIISCFKLPNLSIQYHQKSTESISQRVHCNATCMSEQWLTIDNSCVVSSFNRTFSGILALGRCGRSPTFCGLLMVVLMDGSWLSSRWRSRDIAPRFSGTAGWSPSIDNQCAEHMTRDEILMTDNCSHLTTESAQPSIRNTSTRWQ